MVVAVASSEEAVPDRSECIVEVGFQSAVAVPVDYTQCIWLCNGNVVGCDANKWTCISNYKLVLKYVKLCIATDHISGAFHGPPQICHGFVLSQYILAAMYTFMTPSDSFVTGAFRKSSAYHVGKNLRPLDKAALSCPIYATVMDEPLGENSAEKSIVPSSVVEAADSSGWSESRYNKTASFVYTTSSIAPVLALLDSKPGERIFDVGCGSGEVTLQIAETVGK